MREESPLSRYNSALNDEEEVPPQVEMIDLREKHGDKAA